MHPAYTRILKALNLEKHMTTRQLARLLYPAEYQKTPRKIYDRLVKNLASLKKEKLLKSKDYGLGKENLWSLKPHPIVKDLGLVAPRSEVHTFKYEHEKACGDVFVTLALTGNLYSWEAHKRVGKVIPDRTAELDTTLYIEVEMGSQDKIALKLSQYQQYFRETREQFDVLFLVQHQRQYDSGLKDLADAGSHYKILTFDMFSDMYSLPVELETPETAADAQV